jgi:hypothetical protein
MFHVQQQEAQKVLTQFQEHPDAWQRVPGILETATNIQSKVRKQPVTLLFYLIAVRFASTYHYKS